MWVFTVTGPWKSLLTIRATGSPLPVWRSQNLTDYWATLLKTRLHLSYPSKAVEQLVGFAAIILALNEFTSRASLAQVTNDVVILPVTQKTAVS